MKMTGGRVVVEALDAWGVEVVFGIPFEKLEGVVENLELLLERRPDLKHLLSEPVGHPHVCTEEELAVQRSPGAILS